MLYFATLFDINYLSRALCLADSLNSYINNYHLYFLALDDASVKYLERHPVKNVTVISLSEIEQFYPELEAAKSNRSKVEYYFTLSPVLPLYILENYPECPRITTLDADIYFFSSPEIIFKNYDENAVLITPHNFSPQNKHLEKWGLYNVSFQSFPRTIEGLAVLTDWKNQCLTWCHDDLDLENDRFADQKYLDKWPAKFKSVTKIDMPGTGLAPWNVEAFDYQLVKKKIMVNGSALIYYHFHDLRIFNNHFAFNGLEKYNARANKNGIRIIYHSYLKALKLYTVKAVNTDKNILRNNYPVKDGLVVKLKNSNGYWFFTQKIIIHINLYRLGKKLQNIWPFKRSLA